MAEGIESGLSALSIGLRPTWTTGSTALMRSFPLLAGVETLTVIADHDANGAGQRAADEVAARWRGANREVPIKLRDRAGDINDALKEHGGS